jgi:superoxide dismutase
MQLHHKKHHQAYVTNLNVALEKYADAEKKSDVSTMISLQQAIKFNGKHLFRKKGIKKKTLIFLFFFSKKKKGGGHINHR